VESRSPRHLTAPRFKLDIDEVLSEVKKSALDKSIPEKCKNVKINNNDNKLRQCFFNAAET
jgi:hypothetical protein